MHFSDNELSLMIFAAGANLQRHHESQGEAARLLKEQNELLAQHLEATRAESARGRGLVRYKGKDITPEEHKRIVEREELARQSRIRHARQEQEERAKQAKQQQEQARQQQEQRDRIQQQRFYESVKEVAAAERDEKQKADNEAREKKRKADANEKTLKLNAISFLESNASKCAESLKEKIALNHLAKQMVAHVIAADGQISPQEFEWVESLWGYGAIKWIIEIIREVSLENTQAQISKVCGLRTEDSTLEHFKSRSFSGNTFERAVPLWAIAKQLQHLGEVDGICDAELQVIASLQQTLGRESVLEKLSAIAEADLASCFENWKRANYMIYLGLRVTAMVVQKDGYFTQAEVSWVERYWGTGASAQVIELASIPDFNRLMDEVIEFSHMADKSTLLEFWLILDGLSGLAASDQSESTASFYAANLLKPIKDKLLSPTSTKQRILA